MYESYYKEAGMRGFRALFVMVLVSLGINAMASCDIISSVPVCEVNKVYEYKTKLVPYKACEEYCVPVQDSCSCQVHYVTKTRCVTRYKEVTVKVFKGYENVGYYQGQRVVKVWPRKLSRIPIRIVNGGCIVCNLR